MKTWRGRNPVGSPPIYCSPQPNIVVFGGVGGQLLSLSLAALDRGGIGNYFVGVTEGWSTRELVHRQWESRLKSLSCVTPRVHMIDTEGFFQGLLLKQEEKRTLCSPYVTIRLCNASSRTLVQGQRHMAASGRACGGCYNTTRAIRGRQSTRTYARA